MKLFDFNIHLPTIVDEDVNIVIEQDLSLSLNQIKEGLVHHRDAITSNNGANFLLFNTKLFDNSNSILEDFKNYNKNNLLTALIDFRRNDIASYIKNLSESGVRAIMFNSYLQKISEADYATVVKVCLAAQEMGLIICIDGSYGTSKMYTYDNLKLACVVADIVTSVPIVIIHSGGYRIMEAFLLASDKTNVWLDSSFSLPYYIGSSLEVDFSFVFKKMSNRVVYGSDHPYLNYKAALDAHLLFFERHLFSTADQENILFNNASRLLNL
jgi:predicted TIM-barrel fold metal-dependent hydrolase